MSKETPFGEFLRKRRRVATLTQEGFAEQLSLDVGVQINPVTISNWERGVRTIDHNDRRTLVGIVRVLYRNGGLSFLEESDFLLRAGNYRDLDEPEIQEVNPEWLKPKVEEGIEPETRPEVKVFGGSVTEKGDIYITSPLSPSILLDWIKGQLRWEDAGEHMRSSRAGLFLWSFGVIIEKITPRGFLWLFSSLAIWTATAWLIVPILQWPLLDPWRSCVQYAIATLAIPLVIGLLTSPENRPYKLETNKQCMTLWTLKITGAFVSFNGMTLFLFFPALGWYYLTQFPLPTRIGWLLTLIPLIFSHIAAQRIPADRYKMYGGTLRMHPTDKLFLTTFSVIGIFAAGFIFYGTPFLANPAMGFTMLLVLSGVALWEQRKRIRNYLTDAQLIIVIGCLLPILNLLIYFVAWDNFGSLTSVNYFLELVLVVIYVTTPFTLWITLIVRTKPVLTFPGVFGAGGVLIFLLMVLAKNPTWGRTLALVAVGVWILWGHRRFRHFLWVHPSFPLMVLGLVVSLIALFSEWLPVWANIPLFLLFAIGDIIWAYRAGNIL